MNGIIIVNKPKDYTSRDVVNILSKVLNTKKVGHTGTLDPLAEGVLVCTVGKCTKLCEYLTSETKEYIATMQFGILTDTLDVTGNILKTSDIIPKKAEIENALKYFERKYYQEVPLYSSVKVKGKKLYEYARNEELVELPKRLVEIKKIELLEYHNDIVKFKVLVSKGTYIRSLIRDIGSYLQTYATMTALVRTKQGKYSLENSYTIEQIKNNNYKILSLEDLFKEYPLIEVNKEEKIKIQNGQEFNNIYKTNFVLFTYKKNLIALYVVNKKNLEKIKPLILV